MKILRKLYTKYDDTDSLKKMNDSDILAESKKKKPGFGNAVAAGVAGAGIGAGVGSITGGFRKPMGSKAFRVGTSMGARKGALIGGAIAAGAALYKRSKKSDDVKFYNDRLKYAQRQALRREKKDWKNNMTQRESYTY